MIFRQNYQILWYTNIPGLQGQRPRSSNAKATDTFFRDAPSLLHFLANSIARRIFGNRNKRALGGDVQNSKLSLQFSQECTQHTKVISCLKIDSHFSCAADVDIICRYQSFVFEKGLCF